MNPEIDESWRLSAAEVREFSRISDWRSAAQICIEIALIGLAIYAGERWRSPWLYPFVIVWIGARQHALLVLMHDSAHGRLFSHRGLNDAAGELLAWPMFVTMHGFRRSHLAHHQFLGTEKDPDLTYWKDSPDYRFPMERGRLARLLAAHALGLKSLDLLRMILGYFTSKRGAATHQNGSDRPGVQLLRYGLYAAALLAVSWFGWWRGFALYWLVPAFTWLTLILYFRSISEHYGLDGSDAPLRATRTLVLGVAARWLVAPNWINLHIEHHLYPSVPFHRLPRLRRHFLGNEAYRRQAHATCGLSAAFCELSGQAARAP